MIIHEDLIIVTPEDRLPPLVEFDFPAELDEVVSFRVPNKALTLTGIVREIDLEDNMLRVEYTRPNCGTMSAWISAADLVETVEYCPDCGLPLNVGRHQIRRAVDDFYCDVDGDYDDLTARVVLAMQAGRRVK